MSLSLRSARPGEGPLVLGFVRELAEYERLTHQVDASEAMIERALFGPGANAFAEIAEWAGEPVGFALWFLNFSTFRGRNGLYLEDLFVRPSHRGRGIGQAMLGRLARKCVENDYARFEWSVLDWNAPSIRFYEARGAAVLPDWRICRVEGEALRRLAGDP
jgi:GNAT superfamily N-acetyltransferase